MRSCRLRGTMESVVPEAHDRSSSAVPCARGAATSWASSSRCSTLVRLSTGHFTSISQSLADVNSLPPSFPPSRRLRCMIKKRSRHERPFILFVPVCLPQSIGWARRKCKWPPYTGKARDHPSLTSWLGRDVTTKRLQLRAAFVFPFLFLPKKGRKKERKKERNSLKVQQVILGAYNFVFSCRTTITARYEPNSTQE